MTTSHLVFQCHPDERPRWARLGRPPAARCGKVWIACAPAQTPRGGASRGPDWGQVAPAHRRALCSARHRTAPGDCCSSGHGPRPQARQRSGGPARSAGSCLPRPLLAVPGPLWGRGRDGPAPRLARARAKRWRRRGLHAACDGAARGAQAPGRGATPSRGGHPREDAASPPRSRPAAAAGAL